MPGIVRTRTEAEKVMTPIGTDGNTTGFIPIMGREARKETAQQKFERELRKHEQEATKKGLPFARHAAREEVKDYFEAETKRVLRKKGYIEAGDIKPIKIEWEKYSDLKNFKVTKEDEVPDDNLSNKNPGLDVTVKKTEYRFKDFERYMYRVMESKESAIRRARKKLSN